MVNSKLNKKNNEFTEENKFDVTSLKEVFQDCHVNFLIGAGLSTPYLSLLGNIENLLTELSEKKEKDEICKKQEKIIRFSLYKKIFNDIILKNIDLLSSKIDHQPSSSDCLGKDCYCSILEKYKDFITTINTILLERKNTTLNKQVNIFTTNIDIFLEKALELTNVEYNDGFLGRFNPIFETGCFKKLFHKTSLHYDQTYELPVFNLIKIHGSLSWKKKGEGGILFDSNLQSVKNIKDNLKTTAHLNIEKNKFDDLISQIKDISQFNFDENFINGYEKLLIINPTKEKFKETLLNRNYYEMLRIYSNELEKENTLLFVMGFSFSDEHIQEITLRAINSNPTLMMYICIYDEKEKEEVQYKFKHSNNRNIRYISFEDITNKSSDDKNHKDNQNNKLDFHNINKIFNKLLGEVDGKQLNKSSN